jgi:hypothetical protein
MGAAQPGRGPRKNVLPIVQKLSFSAPDVLRARLRTGACARTRKKNARQAFAKKKYKKTGEEESPV